MHLLGPASTLARHVVPGVKKSAAETVLLMRCAAGVPLVQRAINIRVAKTSCTRAVDGSGLSIRLGSCVAGAPHRLDKVDWVWLPRGHRQHSCRAGLLRGEVARSWRACGREGLV